VTELSDITPEAYGVGARFTLSVYDSDYVRIILDALAAADPRGLAIETDDISTWVTGSEQRVLSYVSDVVAAAAASGAHLSVALMLSRGCPAGMTCELPAGVRAIGSDPVALEATGVRARAHWSLYPLLDGGSEGDHLTPILEAIEQAKTEGVYDGLDHGATRLDADLSRVLETVANAWIGVGAVVQHVTTHVTISIGSPGAPA
jgi:uncharacterized protein YqgV (UPF0045/DUF77 family)